MEIRPNPYIVVNKKIEQIVKAHCKYKRRKYSALRRANSSRTLPKVFSPIVPTPSVHRVENIPMYAKAIDTSPNPEGPIARNTIGNVTTGNSTPSRALALNSKKFLSKTVSLI